MAHRHHRALPNGRGARVPLVPRHNLWLNGLIRMAKTKSTHHTTDKPADDASRARSAGDKPNILVIWGDDIGLANVSAYSSGVMGYETPNIDRIGKEGIRFLQYYGEQSCTAGRSAFLTGQHIISS